MACAKALLVFFCLVAVAVAHVRLEYNPNNGLTVRDAATPTGNGGFSVEADGCGGNTEFGSNGVNDIAAGTSVTMLFNYGTGTNGDHAAGTNVFHVAVVPLQATAPDTKVLMGNSSYWLAQVPAAEGSRPGGYQATITIPTTCIGQCVLVVNDQRFWGGCHDLLVTDPGIAVQELQSGQQRTEAVVANSDRYYSIPMEVNEAAFVSFTLPTGVQLAVRSGAVPSIEANEGILSVSGNLPICGKNGAPGFIGVFQSAAATGSVAVTATTHTSFLEIDTPVTDEIPAAGSKYYASTAYSVESGIRRMVVRKTGGTASFSLIRGEPEECPPTALVSDDAVTVGCVEMGTLQGKKYIRLQADGSMQYSLVVERGSCDEIKDEDNASTTIAVSIALLIASIALFF